MGTHLPSGPAHTCTMRLLSLLAVLSLLACVCAAPQPRDDSVDNYIKMVLENFADAMKTGIPILGIPILDPLDIGHIEIPEIDSSAFRLKANASKMVLNDLSTFSPTTVHVDFDNAALTLGLHVVNVKLEGIYWADGLALSLFPIFGEGGFYIRLVSTDIDGLGDITVTPDDYLQIEDLQLAVKFDDLEIYFDNFLGGGSLGDVMNDVLSTLSETILDIVLPMIQDKVIPPLLAYLNEELHKHTIGEIIDGILP